MCNSGRLAAPSADPQARPRARCCLQTHTQPHLGVLCRQRFVDQRCDALQHVLATWRPQVCCILFCHQAHGLAGEGAVQAPGH